VHVLVLPSWYPTTEAPTNGVYFAEQARMLADDGTTVGVVYPEHQSLRHASPGALWRKRFQTGWSSASPPTLRRYSWNVWWRLPRGLERRIDDAVDLARRYVDQRGRPDLVHAHSAQWAGAAAARIKADLGIPYVLTEHFSGFHRGAVFSWQEAAVRTGLREADAVAAVSTALRDTLDARGLRDAADIAVCPNPVDPTVFTRPPAPRSSPPPFRIATVARLHGGKRIDVLLRAVALAFGDDPDVRLTIGGDGPARGDLRELAQQLGLSDRVSFPGALSRDGVRTLLWDAHLFALPSAYETFGVVLVEAMATGCPVVTTAAGGPTDIVTETVGRHLPGAGAAELAQALRDMRNSWGAMEPAAIRASALGRFGPETFLRQTRSLYRRALSSAGDAPARASSA
jgi:glycosyltransferase involved in cell wall biosynthesis